MDIFTALPYISEGKLEAAPTLERFLPPAPPGPALAFLARDVPPGAWILDPFGSAPGLVVAAARAGYRVLVAANNPIARFLIELAAQPPAPADFQGALADLALSRKEKEPLEAHIQSLYSTECAQCHRLITADAFIWDKTTGRIVSRLYKCPHCKDEGERDALASDNERAAKWAATDGLHRSRAIERVAPRDDPDREYAAEALENYLPRAVYVLSTLINRIDQLSLNEPRRKALMALLLHACDMGNSLWPHPTERKRPRKLETPPRFRENNIWRAIEAALKIWTDESGRGAHVPFSEWPGVPPAGAGGVCLFEGALRDIVSKLEEIDIKAALGALPRPNQAYWTLSALWAGWLWGREAAGPFKIVLRRRRYDWQWHAEALRAALGNLAKILREGTPFFALLGEPEPGFMAATLIAGQINGFALNGIAARTQIDPAHLLWQRKDAPAAAQPLDRKIIVGGLREFLSQRGEPVTYFHAHAAGVAALAANNALTWTNEAVSETNSAIDEALRDPMFAHIDAHTSMESGLRALAAGTPDILADQVELIVVRYLQAQAGATRAQIEAEVHQQCAGLLTPPAAMISAVLDSYAMNENGYRLRAEDHPATRRAEIKTMAVLIELLGARLNYAVEKISENRLAWRAGERIVYLFDVVASAMLGKLLQENPAPHATRVIVLPGGRAGLAAYKLKRDSTLRKRLEDWRFLKYRHLREVVELPLVSRETWPDQLQSDPIEQAATQLMLF